MMKYIYSLLIISLLSMNCLSQPQRQVVYKSIDDSTKLVLNFYFPKDYASGKTYPVMVFTLKEADRFLVSLGYLEE